MEATSEFYVEFEPQYSYYYGNDINGAKAVKMTKKKPTVRAGNIAVRMRIKLDTDVFPEMNPVLDAALVVDPEQVIVGDVETEQLPDPEPE